MRAEERVAAFVAIRVVLSLLVAGTAALSAAYYRYGPHPVFFILLLGVPLALVLLARVLLRRRAPSDGAAARDAARRLRERLDAIRAPMRRVSRRRRVRQVELAAAAAARQEELLSPERVRTAAESLFRLVRLASNEGDRGRLATLLGPELLSRSEQGANERLDVVGDVSVEYVGFTTAGAVEVVVLIEAMLEPWTGSNAGPRGASHLRRVCQYWTLGLRDGLWRVLAIEEHGAGKHHLDEPIGAPAAA